MVQRYSFCETIAAYRWHIRPLTAAGQKFGGGADTRALCKAFVEWDIDVGLSATALEGSGICSLCRRAFHKIQTAQAEGGGE